jgi:hypothetical protein
MEETIWFVGCHALRLRKTSGFSEDGQKSSPYFWPSSREAGQFTAWSSGPMWERISNSTSSSLESQTSVIPHEIGDGIGCDFSRMETLSRQGDINLSFPAIRPPMGAGPALLAPR